MSNIRTQNAVISSRAIPSVAAVRYYIARTFPRRLKALARDGENAFQQRFRDYIERDPETIRPNECWVADSRTLDFMVRSMSAGNGFRFGRRSARSSMSNQSMW